jgi:formylglycine-generating enzyme required for sulfatase activity
MPVVLKRVAPLFLLALTFLSVVFPSCSPKEESKGQSAQNLTHPKSPSDPTLEMVFIPASAFLMGSNDEDKEGKGAEFGTVKPLYMDEHPLHRVYLYGYWIDKYEVTNLQYKAFVEVTNSRPPRSWPGGVFPVSSAHYPVTYVNWYEASRFCQWAGKHLPTEAQWEKAARGTDGRIYPWGNEFDGKRANTGESGQNGVAPVGSYEMGKSPYGVYDMVGNVWEWTEDWYKPYPGNTYTSDAFGEKHKILRGGSWGGTGHYALPIFYRTTYRLYAPPEEAYPDGGFRCAKDR